MLQDLPSEVICKIIGYLPIQNTVLLRRVSKRLRQVTYDRSIWAQAYRTSSLLRPSGPFTWQTSQILESYLVRSTRLSLNWSPNPGAVPVRSRPINTGKPGEGPKYLLCSRWLLVQKGPNQILCYDWDRAEQPMSQDEQPYSILYECPENDGSITFLDCDSAFVNHGSTDEENYYNPLAFLLVGMRDKSHLHFKAIYKVNFADGNFPTLLRIHQTRGDTQFPSSYGRLKIGPKLLAVYHSTPVGTLKEVILIDIVTYQLYQLSEVDMLNAEGRFLRTLGTTSTCSYQTIITTSTHVLRFSCYITWSLVLRRLDEGILIEAYEIPSPQIALASSEISQQALPSESIPTTLHLSHEATTDKHPILDESHGASYPSSFTSLRDSTTDHTTQTLRIVVIWVLKSYLCVIPLILNPASPDIGVGRITFEPSTNNINIDLGRIPGEFKIQPSFGGHTRGIWHYLDGTGTMRVTALNIVDGHLTNSQIAVELDMAAFPEFRSDEACKIVGFDGHCGRIFVMHPHSTLVVYDFV
ncbi:hypothetical protein BJ138DRAFT_1161070 [Hygrophoropsis aurantiaca]|uniref:Uncharacterized protein n=1 Tax=Hygrophoropsis aurantiaca TaxID=72124 RepID=A0ACB8A229_9AGAM|nr:hypothetical protein BJ138DRAFT_1161070 [Hygrophoropsis aurantiaca]